MTAQARPLDRCRRLGRVRRMTDARIAGRGATSGQTVLRRCVTHTPSRPRAAVDRRRHAHGYVEVDGKLVDVNLDPSFAGAAGGYALLTTAGDLLASWTRCSRVGCSATARRCRC